MIRALDYESSRPSSNRSRRRRGHCVCLLSMTLGSHSLSTTVYKLVLANCWDKLSHFPLHPDLHIQKSRERNLSPDEMVHCTETRMTE